MAGQAERLLLGYRGNIIGYLGKRENLQDFWAVFPIPKTKKIWYN
jgi:hypothetical protein